MMIDKCLRHTMNVMIDTPFNQSFNMNFMFFNRQLRWPGVIDSIFNCRFPSFNCNGERFIRRRRRHRLLRCVANAIPSENDI